MALLGGDRQASRNELRKLTLYAHGEGEVTLEDVMAVVADASELKIDPIVDGAFAGKPELVETEFAKAMIAGTYPGMIISAAQRQAAWLHKSALAVAEGTPVSTLLDSGFPRLHFSRKAKCRNRAAKFQRGAPDNDHRTARLGRAGNAQTGAARRRDRAAHAAVDRGECKTAGVRPTSRRFALIQSPHDLIELIEVAVADVHGAAGIAVIDIDRKAERVADALFQRDRVGVFRLAAARLLGFANRNTLDMRQRFGLAHIEAFIDNAFGGRGRIGHADQRAGVAGRQLARCDVGLHLGRQFRQPHHVGDMAAALADDLRNLVLAAFEFIGERMIALRLFHRIEIFALHVFDDRDLERLAVVDIDRHDRNLVQAGDLRCAPAAFAGDDFETVLRALDRTHHDRLDHAVLPDRIGELGQVRHRKNRGADCADWV